jgi:hypothetical protein
MLFYFLLVLNIEKQNSILQNIETITQLNNGLLKSKNRKVN